MLNINLFLLLLSVVVLRNATCVSYCNHYYSQDYRCEHGCFFGYTPGMTSTQTCLSFDIDLEPGKCKADFTVDGERYGFACACTSDNCNIRHYMGIQAACYGVYGIEPSDTLFYHISICECAKKNKIPCSHAKHGQIGRTCSFAVADQMCPGF